MVPRSPGKEASQSTCRPYSHSGSCSGPLGSSNNQFLNPLVSPASGPDFGPCGYPEPKLLTLLADQSSLMLSSDSTLTCRPMWYAHALHSLLAGTADTWAPLTHLSSSCCWHLNLHTHMHRDRKSLHPGKWLERQHNNIQDRLHWSSTGYKQTTVLSRSLFTHDRSPLSPYAIIFPCFFLPNLSQPLHFSSSGPSSKHSRISLAQYHDALPCIL